MPIFKVKVKWGKELFKDVEANTDEDPMVFKAQLFALTGVHPDRQKVVIKGTNLKDWSSVEIKDGMQMLLLGSKDEDLPQAPAEKPVFIEDMSENELANALEVPAGLSNLGNTCYLNATLQCLKTVPELRDALTAFNQGRNVLHIDGSAEGITMALRDLYSAMDKSGKEVLPIILLQAMHLAIPRFAEKSPQGGFQQQDANECWTEMARMLQQQLSPLKEEHGNESKFKSFIEQFFGGIINFEMKCTEADEPITKGTENFLQLSCFISQEVRYMMSGLKNKMQEPITKHSETLGRDAVYQKNSKISRLPAYLTIQFVRFFYKESKSINAKILKDIKFPIEFDAYELCTTELQEKLAPMRAKFKEVEDKLIDEQLRSKSSGEENRTKEKTNEKETEKITYEPFSFPDDLGSNNSGYYTLQAVLTHKGRSSSSGHYVAWIRHKNNVWFMCDDDNVTPVNEEDVLKLSGGGDWHIAYVLLYGPKLLRITDKTTEPKMSGSGCLVPAETMGMPVEQSRTSDDEGSNVSLDTKENIIKLLDDVEKHVEFLRKQAAALEDEKDSLCNAIDSIKQCEVVEQLVDLEKEEILHNIDRIFSRISSIDICIRTERDSSQEDALSEVNSLINRLVQDGQRDRDAAKSRCVAFMNTCGSNDEGPVDKSFESALLGCAVDDQKRIRRRLKGLMQYLDRLTLFQG